MYLSCEGQRILYREVVMNRSSLKQGKASFALLLSLTLSGCVTNPIPTATVWDKLGITGASARLRDATINRNGNFPGLEKKPPVLRIADPANLAPEKPEVIKTAAKIKQDQDLKQQKLKAIKFLAEVNCGCFNKDDAVAKAFLEALNDCDPDVRKEAVSAICKTAGDCSKCRTGCETTCCTQEILDKLNDMAYGKDSQGCPKEPVAEIRSLAAAAARKCPPPQSKPLEELPTPPPESIEELVTPTDPVSPIPSELDSIPNKKSGSELDPQTRQPNDNAVKTVSFKIENGDIRYDAYGSGTEPVHVAVRKGKKGESIRSIVNPSQMVAARVVSVRPHLGEMLIELPDLYEIRSGFSMVVVDKQGNHQVGVVNDSSGRRVLLGFETNCILKAEAGSDMRVGLVRN